MSFSNTAEQAILDLLFLNSAFANVGDAGGLRPSAAAGSLYIALHTGALTDTSAQNTNEAAYTGYARVAVARSGAGWSRTGSTMSNVAAVQFPLCTGGSETLTHFSIGLATSGATTILMYGTLNAPMAVSNGIQPQFAAGALTASLD